MSDLYLSIESDFGKPLPKKEKREGESDFQHKIRQWTDEVKERPGRFPGGHKQAIAIAAQQAGLSKAEEGEEEEGEEEEEEEGEEEEEEEMENNYSPILNLLKAGKGEGSRGGKIIGHTKAGNPIYAPSKGHIDRVREHVNLQKRTAAEKLEEHAEAHTSGHGHYTSECHTEAAAAHGKEAKDYGNSPKVRAFHQHIADAHTAHAAGKPTPATARETKRAKAAASRKKRAAKKEAARPKDTIGTTRSGHEIKNTHHIRSNFGGEDLHSGPKSSVWGPGVRMPTPNEPVETELGDHLDHKKHSEIADFHGEKANEHSRNAARRDIHMSDRIGHKTKAAQHRHAQEIHEEHAKEKKAKVKPNLNQLSLDFDKKASGEKKASGGKKQRVGGAGMTSTAPAGATIEYAKSLTRQAIDILKGVKPEEEEDEGPSIEIEIEGFDKAVEELMAPDFETPANKGVQAGVGIGQTIGSAASSGNVGSVMSVPGQAIGAIRGGGSPRAGDDKGDSSDDSSPPVSSESANPTASVGDTAKALTSRSLVIPMHLRTPGYDPTTISRSATTQTSRMYTSLAEPVQDTIDDAIARPWKNEALKSCGTHGLVFKSHSCPMCEVSKSIAPRTGMKKTLR